MPHFETRMGADGKLVVPEDVQSAFKLKPGDIIDFYLDETARTARIRARISIFPRLRKCFRLVDQRYGQRDRRAFTLPTDLRELWNLKPGDQIGFARLDASEGRIRPIRRRSIFESMKDLPPLSLGRPLMQSDIEDAITEAVTEREARSRGERDQ